jgi:ribosomal protein S18 acetylase RimI-like enzyme
MTNALVVRRATPADAYGILRIYQDIYSGTYPDPLMTEVGRLTSALSSDQHCCMIATDGELVAGTVSYRIDRENRLAKAFGAVVLPAYRGANIARDLLVAGWAELSTMPSPIEIVYATTRTVSTIPQEIAARLGYRSLGIFPNVHRTDKFETHCLSTFYAPSVLDKRHTDFALHPKIVPLFDIVRAECGLAPLDVATVPSGVGAGGSAASRKSARLDLEVIVADRFAQHRFRVEKSTVERHHWFFPFLRPNVLLTNPEQSVEVFAHVSASDKYCVLLGIRDLAQIGYPDILRLACRLLHDALATRYIEFVVRADETERISSALDAGFIPCAYFPAMQLSNDRRYDFVVFSRSFEILDFHDIRLDGINHKYLMQYFEAWKNIALGPILLDV